MQNGREEVEELRRTIVRLVLKEVADGDPVPILLEGRGLDTLKDEIKHEILGLAKPLEAVLFATGETHRKVASLENLPTMKMVQDLALQVNSLENGTRRIEEQLRQLMTRLAEDRGGISTPPEPLLEDSTGSPHSFEETSPPNAAGGTGGRLGWLRGRILAGDGNTQRRPLRFLLAAGGLIVAILVIVLLKDALFPPAPSPETNFTPVDQVYPAAPYEEALPAGTEGRLRNEDQKDGALGSGTPDGPGAEARSNEAERETAVPEPLGQ